MLMGSASLAFIPLFSAAPQTFDRLGMITHDWIDKIKRMLNCEIIISCNFQLGQVSTFPADREYRCCIRYIILYRVH